jgi:hypothetical protein
MEEKSGCPTVVVTDANPRFNLNDEIWIERLDTELAKNIQTACEPSNFNIANLPWDRHLYAFVRSVPTELRKYQGTEALFATIALSRLIHPTSIGSRYVAVVFHQGKNIQAVQFGGISPDAAISSGQRDWLSVEDGENLRKLMVWVPETKPMHKRIHRAYWNHEYAMRSYYLDMRWTIVVSGLESLVSVFNGKGGTGKQFREGVGKLASELKVIFGPNELKIAWDMRSQIAHGQDFLHSVTVLPQNQHTDLYRKLEEVLRSAVRRCLLDDMFAKRFQDDATVEKEWH